MIRGAAYRAMFGALLGLAAGLSASAEEVEKQAAPAADQPAGLSIRGIISDQAPGPKGDLRPNPGAGNGSIDPDRFGARLPDAAYGAFQRGLYKTALNLALPKAEGGNSAAQTLVAEILSRGLGVPRNEAEAARWYERAARQGVPEAQFQYALMLIEGRFVKADRSAGRVLMKAAAEGGNRLAQFNFAQLLVSVAPGVEGLDQAAPFYQRAADAGLADAQYAVARMHADGVGGRRQDDAEARRWLALAARQNYDTAQLDLGAMLMEGRGGPRDEKGGFGWLRQAAESGNVAAQNRLAKLYMTGVGADPDTIAAAAWYFLARRGGLMDPIMEDFLDGLTDDEQKVALERANRLR